MHIVLDVPRWLVDVALVAFTISSALGAYKTLLQIKINRLRK